MFYHTIYKNRAKLKHFVSVWQVIPIIVVRTLMIIFQHLFLFLGRFRCLTRLRKFLSK